MRLRRCLAMSLLALGLVLSARADHGKEQAVTHALKGWALAPFTLIDHHGRKFTHDQLLGRWTFVVFGDTRACPGQPCGAALTALAGLSQRIARTEVMQTTQVLFISLDPQHDTPARLRVYLGSFARPVLGVTGAPDALRSLTDDMGSGREMTVAGTPGASPHYRGSVFLIGPDASIRAEYLPPLDMPRLTSAYMRTRISRR